MRDNQIAITYNRVFVVDQSKEDISDCKGLRGVAMVTSLCPLCTGVSQMNSPMAQTQSQNETLHGCVAHN